MDAVATPFLNEHLASWIMILVSLPLAWVVVRTVKETNYEDEKTVYVDDVKREAAEHAHGHGHGHGPESSSIEKQSVEATA